MKQLIFKTIDEFERAIKELHGHGYFCEGTSLHNVNKAAYEWKRGMRVINIYNNDKVVKVAAKPQK